MSFNFSFTAETAEDAQKIIGEEHMPECVKTFITVALSAFPGKPVYVKAIGHLYSNDYTTSTADIAVGEAVIRKPKA
jgi:hypothetical protein